MIRFPCPNCGQHLETEDDMAGLSVPCPACGSELVVSGSATEPPADTSSGSEAAADASSPPKHCRQCGARLSGWGRFCAACGAPAEGDSSSYEKAISDRVSLIDKRKITIVAIAFALCGAVCLQYRQKSVPTLRRELAGTNAVLSTAAIGQLRKCAMHGVQGKGVHMAALLGKYPSLDSVVTTLPDAARALNSCLRDARGAYFAQDVGAVGKVLQALLTRELSAILTEQGDPPAATFLNTQDMRDSVRRRQEDLMRKASNAVMAAVVPFKMRKTLLIPSALSANYSSSSVAPKEGEDHCVRFVIPLKYGRWFNPDLHPADATTNLIEMAKISQSTLELNGAIHHDEDFRVFVHANSDSPFQLSPDAERVTLDMSSYQVTVRIPGVSAVVAQRIQQSPAGTFSFASTIWPVLTVSLEVRQPKNLVVESASASYFRRQSLLLNAGIRINEQRQLLVVSNSVPVISLTETPGYALQNSDLALRAALRMTNLIAAGAAIGNQSYRAETLFQGAAPALDPYSYRAPKNPPYLVDPYRVR